MTDRPGPELSAELAAALDWFRPFINSDDDLRGKALDAGDRETLTDLADSLEPLYAEINRVLDQFDAAPRPLPEGQDDLEIDLHALAQAGLEARIYLDENP